MTVDRVFNLIAFALAECPKIHGRCHYIMYDKRQRQRQNQTYCSSLQLRHWCNAKSYKMFQMLLHCVRRRRPRPIVNLKLQLVTWLWLWNCERIISKGFIIVHAAAKYLFEFAQMTCGKIFSKRWQWVGATTDTLRLDMHFVEMQKIVSVRKSDSIHCSKRCSGNYAVNRCTEHIYEIATSILANSNANFSFLFRFNCVICATFSIDSRYLLVFLWNNCKLFHPNIPYANWNATQITFPFSPWNNS